MSQEVKVDINKLKEKNDELNALLSDTEEFEFVKGTIIGAGVGVGMVAMPVLVGLGAAIAGVLGYLFGSEDKESMKKLQSQYQKIIARQNIIIEEQAETTKKMEEAIERLKSDKEEAENELNEIKVKMEKYTQLLKRISALRTAVEC